MRRQTCQVHTKTDKNEVACKKKLSNSKLSRQTDRRMKNKKNKLDDSAVEIWKEGMNLKKKTI